MRVKSIEIPTVLQLEVLVLNSSWIPIGIRSVQSSLSMMASGNAKGMDFTDGSCIPIPWEDWLALPIRESDDVVHTGGKLSIRVPRVVLTKYSKMPVKRRRLTMRNLVEYHDHVCAYSGKKLTKSTRSVDHILPKAKGGKTSWENCVPCDKKINSIKADRTPEEAGLKLLIKPHEPRRVPFSEVLKKKEIRFEEWKIFIKAA